MPSIEPWNCTCLSTYMVVPARIELRLGEEEEGAKRPLLLYSRNSLDTELFTARGGGGEAMASR